MTSATAFPYKSSQQTTESEGGISSAFRKGYDYVTSHIFEKPTLRQEIPIERWCYQYRKETTPFAQEDLVERGYALLFTLEGIARVVMESVQLVVAKFFTKEVVKETRHQAILNAQLHSVRLTAWAIVEPNGVKKHIQTPAENGSLVLGCQKSEMEWGTPYDGEHTIPFLSTHYNWRS
jgi:hypothetical protein